jgi:peptidoglycan hydrolase-like protein with peptidoglycan-binding domain
MIVATVNAHAQTPETGLLDAARVLYESAEPRPEADRLNDYRSVRRLLDLIVTNHPETETAVQILLGQTVNGIDVAALDAALASGPNAAPEATAPEPTAGDSTAGAQAAVPVLDPFGAQALAPPEAAVMAAPPITEPRPERDIVRDLQEELNRLGCNAGGADGIPGRMTRAAFALFLRNSGADLPEDALPTEAALEAARATRDPVCALRWVSSNAPGLLAGSWGYRADCQALFRRIRITGTVELAHQGGGRYAGSARNSLGERGTAAAQVSGNAVATVLAFPGGQVRGNFVTSTRGMSMSGRDSNGCDVVAWKS